MKLKINEHDVTVYLGDAAEVLAEQAAGSVQCIVTSPPYYALRDYGVDGQLGLESSPAEYVAAMVAVFDAARAALADDGVLWLNLGDSYSGSWGNQGRKDERGTQRPINAPMLQPVHDGRYPSNGSNTGAVKPGAPPAKNLLGMPWRVAFGLQDAGWILRNAVIWNKPNAMPESVLDRLSCRYEHVFLFSKSRRYWFDLDPIREPLLHPDAADGTRVFGGKTGGAGKVGSAFRINGGMPNTYGTQKQGHVRPQTGKEADPSHSQVSPGGRNPGDVWTIPTSPFPGAHFACMPPELARRCILAGCPENGTVYDPFTGSGTTAMVARSLGRRFVGSELNPDYIDIIRGRIGPTPFDFAQVGAK